MKHLLLKAVTTATDEGTFTAVISAASIDREKDIVDPAGMVAALHKWIATGKQIPLAWNHSTAAEDIIGRIDPASAKAVGSEVVVDGWMDQSTPRGQEAWRLVKSGTLGFSFGYLTLKGSARRGGGQHIKELDVFEVTATPTPMNNDTRVLAFKAMTQDEQVRMLTAMHGQARQYVAGEPDQADQERMRQVMTILADLGAEETTEGPESPEDTGKSLPGAIVAPASVPARDDKTVDVTDQEPSQARSVDPLRARADALALEYASGGESLKKPPQPAKTVPPALIPLRDLKARMREEMLTALSGGHNE